MGTRIKLWSLIIGLMLLGVAIPVQAATFNSSNFSINGNLGDSISGGQSSTSYQLVPAGGESITGSGSSSSYKLGQGYVARLEQSIELILTPSSINLGTVTPGTSNAVDVDATIATDAPGYSLAVRQNNDLTSGGFTIPPVSGSIASPVSWAEGTTKGLGFSLVSSTATAISGVWNAGSSYAAFPGSDTSFYTRTGYTGGTTDTLSMRVRLDTTVSQEEGSYANIATWTGTTTP